MPSITDSMITELTAGQKKWLGLKSTDILEQSGLTTPQIHYVKSFSTKPVSIESLPNDLLEKLEANRQAFITNSNPFQLFEAVATPTITPSFTAPSTPNLSQKVHDLQVRYLECYAKHGNNVVSIRDFALNDGKIKVLFKDLKDNGNLGPLREEEYSDDLFDYTLPKLGFVNHGLGVVLVERNHKRSSPSKYRRALRYDTLKMIDLCVREKKSIGIPAHFDKDLFYPEESFRRLAKELFFQQYPSFQEALGTVLNLDRLAVAFSSTLAIRLDSMVNKIVLYKNIWPIGEWSDKDGAFIMHINTFDKDLIKHNIPFIGA